MKQLIIGTFGSRENAEKAIDQIHNELNIGHDEISYIYRNTNNEIKEVDTHDVSSNTPQEGAMTGAKVGGTIGAIAGIATVAGMIPVIGPVFAAGPLVTALGISGAVGTTAAGAVTGAAAGGLIGALANLGVSQDKANEYNDRVTAGNILVAVHADASEDVSGIMARFGAEDVESFTPAV